VIADTDNADITTNGKVGDILTLNETKTERIKALDVLKDGNSYILANSAS